MAADTLWNDVMYTDVLQTPGYVVDFALCTTYSLDMPTLLSVPFMLGTMSNLSEEALRSPHVVLEAVSRAAGRFAVFCNAGGIAVPQQDSKLYALLEQSVVQVALPTQGRGFVNFHPKVWVVTETNPETRQRRMKVVVMSRNLTQSNDLDIACELSGAVGRKTASVAAREKHQPLVDFITWLSDYAHGSIRRRITALLEDLACVERFEIDDPRFQDYDFFPMGIEGYEGRATCLEGAMLTHAAEAVVISPFVDEATLRLITHACPGAKKTLITRHASLTPAMPELFNDGVYVVKEVLTEGMDREDTVDIHEKVYFIRNYYNCQNYLYLGSTNATANGFGRNVEFLMRLTFAPNRMSYSKFRQELIHDGKECLFERVLSVPPSVTPKENSTDEQALRTAVSRIRSARVEPEPSKGYRIEVSCVKRVTEVQAEIYPLYCAGLRQPLADGVTFHEVALPMLSEFFVLAVGDVKRVVKIECKNLPHEERDKAIFRSMIDTKSKFINYLSFMLTEDVDQYIAENSRRERDLPPEAASGEELAVSTSLYEDMLRMAYKSPERVAEIRRVLEQADRRVVPEHFLKMYQQFEVVLKKIKRHDD
jgi:hypothetical protein